jgi:hypothetical protein
MVAPNLSDKGDTRPGPAHLVGPHLPRGPARLLTALVHPVRAPVEDSDVESSESDDDGDV